MQILSVKDYKFIIICGWLAFLISLYAATFLISRPNFIIELQIVLQYLYHNPVVHMTMLLPSFYVGSIISSFVAPSLFYFALFHCLELLGKCD